ncbi:MAG: tRNA glutamyl-Q(34) synthetase GluQRS [Myxococcaceae bacterium]
MAVCGRFAPSPTGPLHLGNARTALLAHRHARDRNGRFLLRIDDLDPERSKRDFALSALADLAWLGLSWDAPPIWQSERRAAYEAAFQKLLAAELAYPCFCSRAEIARAASAPHGATDEGPRYGGTCAQLSMAQRTERTRARKPAYRFRVPPGPVTFVDSVHGPFSDDVSQSVGDFVVQRADGVASYQLATVVDDAESGVTHVIRGDDLLASTTRQLLLYQALGLTPPRFGHLPLLMGPDGQRLAKRTQGLTVREYRERGVSPQRLTTWLEEPHPSWPEVLALLPK